MNIKRVKYKMSKNDEWEIGYAIGKYNGDIKTILDTNFNYIPKIKEYGKEYLAYDIIDDFEFPLNINISIDRL